MKEAIFRKASQLGLIKIVLRVIGENIFFKYNDSQQARRMAQDLMNKGLKIEFARGWIRINLMYNQELIKLGDVEINKDDSPSVKEEKLFNFYVEEYKKAGFEMQNGNT